MNVLGKKLLILWIIVTSIFMVMPWFNYEYINWNYVPPRPSFIINELKLIGIDINNNWVRDDIEREIAMKSSSRDIFETSMLYVKWYQLILNLAQVPKNREDALNILLKPECLINWKRESLAKIDYLREVFNTPFRMKKYEEITKIFIAVTWAEMSKYKCTD